MHSKFSVIGFLGLIALAGGLLAWAIRLELTAYSYVPMAVGGALILVYAAMNIGYLTELLTKKKTAAGANMAVSVVIFLAIVVFLQLILSRNNTRFDYTEVKKFSLASQTINLLEGLGEPITILYLENANNPQANQRAKDLLDLYQDYGSELTYEIVDPEKDPTKVEELAPVTLGAAYIKRGEQHEKVSPVDENNLTNGLMKLLGGGNRVVYFTTGHDEHSLEDDQRTGLMGMKQILEEEGYEPKDLQLYTMETAPEDALAIVVAGPQKPFLETEIQTLRNYLEGGGKLFAMLDPDVETGLEPLLAEYGVQLGNDWVLENNPLMQIFGGRPYIPLMSEVGDHPITEPFQQGAPAISFRVVQSVALADTLPEGVEGTELIKTSAQSWAEKNVDALKQEGSAAFDQGEDAQGPVSIAVAVSKPVEKAEEADNGEDEAAAEEESNGEGEEETGEGAGATVEELDVTPEARLVVFGDSDFATNVSFRNSLDLFVNAINWLSQQEDMISIRPKDDSGKPIMLNQVQNNLVFYTSLVILPLVVAIFGGFVVGLRRMRS